MLRRGSLPMLASLLSLAAGASLLCLVGLVAASAPDRYPNLFGEHKRRPAFDSGFPVVADTNCSKCGGRDGCVGCRCVKKCQAPPAKESLPFVSRTLGSHMVLQRAPASAMVFGHAKLGATVATTFRGKTYTTTTDSVDVGGGQGLGTWRQALPPTPGGKAAHTLSFTSSAGDHASLEDVLFGEVYFCSGQSNMEDPMLTQINATEECERANSFPTIRLFTVGDDNEGRAFNNGGPEHDLQNVMQPWVQASSDSLCHKDNATSYVTVPPTVTPNWHGGDFSAMCWFFGKQISEGLSPTGEVPVGLIASDWGGTALIQWTPADAVADCAYTKNCTGKGWIGGDHYNAMVNPFAVGPMALSGFAWYQGENGCGAPAGADPAGPCITMPAHPNPVFNGDSNLIMYDCLFPAMIKAWRRAFKVPDAYFGFIQLASWMAMGGGARRDKYGNGWRPFALQQAGMRQAQMSGATLPHVGYATYADCGQGVLHPTNKWRPGARLGNSALSIQFGKRVPWISPTYESAAVSVSGGTVSVTVTLGNATALKTATPHNIGPCSRQMRCVPGQQPAPHGRAGIGCIPANTSAGWAGYPENVGGDCGWAAIQSRDGGWANATVSIKGGAGTGTQLVLQAPAALIKGEVVASSYGWGVYAMISTHVARISPLCCAMGEQFE